MNDRICCDTMRSQLVHDCEHHPDLLDCPDVLIIYSPKFDEFGIPIRDGGTSCLTIWFCPWCGESLPESKRDLGFKALEDLGIDDPLEQDIPEPFKSDSWWRSRPT
ncbi:MAG: hypothetical protein IID46_16015 [Planctomycetes bacterium]|nr:hypothetical protein [Planctomycetota bacterium]